MKNLTFIFLTLFLILAGQAGAQISATTSSAGATSYSTASSTTSFNPSAFGNGFWNVYCYNGYSLLTTANTTYDGMYTETSLNFDSKKRWANTGVPSNANGISGNAYSGATINNKHTVSYKRAGFTAGTYQLDVPSHDDDAYLFINGQQVWKHSSYTLTSLYAWTGFLDQNSTIEFRWINNSLTSNGSLTISPIVALPVSIANFQFEQSDNNDIQISWNTASEENVNYFIVEKAKEATGKNITELAMVKAKGNSSSISNYSMTDNKPFEGASYYRLKAVDLDGTVTYSSFVTVRFNKTPSLNLEVYPNPATSENINIAFQNAQTTDAMITVLDAMGNTVYAKAITSSAFADFSLASTQTFAPGVYHVVCYAANETVSKKLIVQ